MPLQISRSNSPLDFHRRPAGACLSPWSELCPESVATLELLE
jgi:hypothetical protein